MESSSVVVSMVKTKELGEDLRMSIVNAHKDGKDYKAISKPFKIPISTVQCIVKKYKKFIYCEKYRQAWTEADGVSSFGKKSLPRGPFQTQDNN